MILDTQTLRPWSAAYAGRDRYQGSQTAPWERLQQDLVALGAGDRRLSASNVSCAVGRKREA